MTITGEMIISGRAVRGSNGTTRALDAATGRELEPAFGGASLQDLDEACAAARAAFLPFRETSLEARATFLEAIAANIEGLGTELIDRCATESGLPRARLEGERARTVGQLRLFATVVREGAFLDVRVDSPLPDRTPAPRPALKLRNIPVGPVAVFGASNFPLAFSVAGGDTASALAAGAPVIAKAHPAHLGTSELVGRAVQQAVRDCGMPDGVFSLLYDSGYEIGQALVADPRIQAVAFTGSRRGGLALMEIAGRRPQPIPVYAEMSSINPVILFPHALSERAEQIGEAFVKSLTLGAGQFCTNPGLVLAVEGEALDRFIAAAAAALTEMPASTMLTPGIHHAYEISFERLAAHPEVETVALGQTGTSLQGRAGLFATTPAAFLAHHELQEEVFGAASLIVRCPDEAALLEVLKSIEGQLTAAIHIVEADYPQAQPFIPLLEEKVGRILVNDFGTGVEVAHAMVHGGPFPSTADGRSTSVGSLAINRFLRPVSYQNLPDALLPEMLQPANPYHLRRRVDGKLE